MSAVTAWEVPQGTPAMASRRHLRVVPEPLVAPRSRPLRLTFRGRLVLLGAGALVLLATVMTAAAVASGPSAPSGPTVTVTRGQTLSEIARAQLPGVPTGEAVVRLQLANGLNSLNVSAGQTLVVPDGS